MLVQDITIKLRHDNTTMGGIMDIRDICYLFGFFNGMIVFAIPCFLLFDLLISEIAMATLLGTGGAIIGVFFAKLTIAIIERKRL